MREKTGPTPSQKKRLNCSAECARQKQARRKAEGICSERDEVVKKLFSIVIPIYKAEENLPHTIPYIMEHSPMLFPDYDIELILVSDASPDHSWEMMKVYQRRYPETIRLARFVHNYGQGIAVIHGLRMARGDVIGVISQDMQDPFELFAEMLHQIEDGCDLACGVRKGRYEKGFSAFCSNLTHWMMHRFVSAQYPIGGTDFFAMTRAVAERFCTVYRQGTYIMSLLESSEKTVFLPYYRKEREYGKSGYSFIRKAKAVIRIFVSSTILPLRVMSAIGFLFSGFAFLFAIVVFIASVTSGSPIPVRGWASLSLLITFFSGLILGSLGLLGEYIWRIYEEVQKKPLYLVAESDGVMRISSHACELSTEDAAKEAKGN